MLENSVFPLPVKSHIIFCVIAVAFFLLQFIRLRYKYQLVLAVAVPATLLVYVSDNRTWFYGVGVLEICLLLLALVLAIMQHKKLAKEEAAKAAAEEKAAALAEAKADIPATDAPVATEAAADPEHDA